MGRTYSVCCLILAILVAGLYEKISVEGKLNLGLIGCRFSKSLCTVKEECVDDRLFGNCQEGGREVDQYQYFLDYKTLRVLEKAIYDLISQGYSWDSLYTQCILGNVLLSFRLDRELDQRICTDFATPPSQPPNEGSSLKSLDRYFNEYYADLSNPLQYEDSVDVRDTGRLSEPEFSKKDEYVNIHKYRGHKRDPYSDDYYEDYPTEDTAADYSQYLESLSPQDLLLLESYLAKIENGGGGESKEERPPPETAVEDYPSENEASEENPDYLWENGPGARISDYDDQVPSLQLPPSSNEAVDVDEIMAADDSPPLSLSANQPLEPATAEKKQDDSESEFLTPEDAKVLGDLLQDKMEVDDLSSEEVDRLTHQVNAMLTSMGGRRGGGEGKEESQEEEEVVNEGTGPDIKLEAKKSKPPINQENTNDQMKQQPVAKSKVRVTLKNIKHKKDSGPSDYVVDIKTLPEEVVEGYSEKIGAAQDHYQVLTTTEPRFALLNTNYAWLQIDKKFKEPSAGFRLVYELQKMLDLPNGTFAKIRVEDDKVTFLVRPNAKDLNSSVVTQRALEQKDALNKATGLNLQDSGIGDKTKVSYAHAQAQPKLYILTFILCGCIAGILIAVVAIYLIKRHTRTREKLAQLTGAGDTGEASKDYQDLCRQRMQSKQSEKPEPLHVTRISSVASEGAVHSPSSRSSTSSWSEEPVTSNMDISTGHIVLSYMEDHMKNKDRLDREWEALVAYEAEPCSLAVASDPAHTRKNRYSDILPYDHSRVILNDTTNVSGSDYVNASTITDHDPRNPAYIATQGPLPHTVADFWQMVWEQGSVVLVMLSKLTEDGVAMCHRYWPEEGSDLYHIYEVHLVSEHIWCDDYMVRSFYLKNLQTNETRTVTQFHFLTWPDLGIPASGAKALLEFRRKVNKSYRGRSCPIVVHCSDGCGRSGTYILIDMVLNRMSKGAKEIDIAATLEHIRDQRMHMAKTKEQFEFVLAAVAEEVHAILKALPQ